MRKLDHTNKRFGRLQVLGPSDKRVYGNIRWHCKCDCGNESIVFGSSLRAGKTKSCGCLTIERSRSRRGSLSSAWKGGRRVEAGYIILTVDDASKYRLGAKKQNEIQEHVKVMSEYLGRPLITQESVHHKNGNRADNRLENLELWSKYQPAGQRVEDKVVWTKEILSLYDPLSLRIQQEVNPDGTPKG